MLEDEMFGRRRNVASYVSTECRVGKRCYFLTACAPPSRLSWYSNLSGPLGIYVGFKGLEENEMQIAVVGSGYVGLVAGACFADLGHDVIVVDNDDKKLAA